MRQKLISAARPRIATAIVETRTKHTCKRLPCRHKHTYTHRPQGVAHTLALKYAFFFCKTHPGDLAALVLPTLLKGCTQPLMPTSSLRHGRTRVRLYGVISVYQSWLARLCMARKANAGSINQGLKLTVHLQRDFCANVQTHSSFQTLAPNAR